ncbi:hypothetical protein L9F63_010744, partial [Diploptera punctata]
CSAQVQSCQLFKIMHTDAETTKRTVETFDTFAHESADLQKHDNSSSAHSQTHDAAHLRVFQWQRVEYNGEKNLNCPFVTKDSASREENRTSPNRSSEGRPVKSCGREEEDLEEDDYKRATPNPESVDNNEMGR